MSLQDDLNEIYAPLLDRNNVLRALDAKDPSILSTFYGPFLLAVGDAYEKLSPRVVIVGQENNGWMACHYRDVLQTLTIDDCLAEYRRFDIAEYGYGAFGRYFAQLRDAFRGPVTEENRRSVLWTNLFKLNHDGQQTIYSPHLDTILALQGDIVKKEIEILRPDVVVFLTGPRYDSIIRCFWPGVAFEQVQELPVGEIAQVKHIGLPSLSFRTYHPGYLNRVLKVKPYLIQSIVDPVLAEFPHS